MAEAVAGHVVVAHLDHQFRLPDALDPASAGRHGGLDAAVQWSYDLLSEPEQLLFERLSVFAGGFTLNNAEAVAGDARLPERGVAAHLLWAYYHVVKKREGIGLQTAAKTKKPARRKAAKKIIKRKKRHG